MDLLCVFCLVFAMLLCASVYMCLVVTCWERADLLALVCAVLLLPVVCHFPIGILGQVWYLIVSIPDLCTLTYFDLYQLFSICTCINFGLANFYESLYLYLSGQIVAVFMYSLITHQSKKCSDL